MKRKLTTIFCADVQNYSTMMSADEAGTLEKLQRYRAIIDNLFSSHDGRKVNTWGDAVIGEFSSVVEAVRCAVEIQDAIGAENRDLPKSKQMWFRIGINLGDVMDDDGDLYGTGVNVAARLEALAEPGGIMVSETVFNLSHKQLAVGYDHIGEKNVKGSEDPVNCYRVRIGGDNKPATPQDKILPEEEAQPASFSSNGKSETPSKIKSGFSAIIERFWSWYPRQPGSVKTAVKTIGILATINIMFSGITNLWFIYPSLFLGAFIFSKIA